MFEFTESIVIDAAPAAVWEELTDLEGWWPASSPEHDSLERLDNRGVGVGVGAVLRIREKIAGVPGEAVGEITRVEPHSAVTWEAPQARYRLLGLRFTIGEAVTWTVEPVADDATRLSAHVSATFPGVRGRLLQWSFTHLLRGVDKDREHTRIELRYLKQAVEAEHTSCQDND